MESLESPKIDKKEIQEKKPPLIEVAKTVISLIRRSDSKSRFKLNVAVQQC